MSNFKYLQNWSATFNNNNAFKSHRKKHGKLSIQLHNLNILIQNNLYNEIATYSAGLLKVFPTQLTAIKEVYEHDKVQFYEDFITIEKIRKIQGNFFLITIFLIWKEHRKWPEKKSWNYDKLHYFGT